MSNTLDIKIATKPSVNLQAFSPFCYTRLNPTQVFNYLQAIKLRVPLIINSRPIREKSLGMFIVRIDTSTLMTITTCIKTCKIIRMKKLPFKNYDMNRKSILKHIHNTNHLIQYLELQPNIEIKSLLTFKTQKTFNSAKLFDQISHLGPSRIPADLDYAPVAGWLVMSCGSFVITAAQNRDECVVRVVHDSSKQGVKDHYSKIVYDDQSKAAVAGGRFSCLLVEFDSEGIKSTRILSHEGLDKSCRFLLWDPSEALIMFSRCTPQKKENFHIFCYSGDGLQLKKSIFSKELFSGEYDRGRKALVYIEQVNSGRRVVKMYPLPKNLDWSEELDSDDGFKIADIPEEYREYPYMCCFWLNRLLVGTFLPII